MKKKTIVPFLIATLCNIFGFAQQGEIIYKTYPNEWISHNGWANTYYYVNDDSIPDIVMHHEIGHGGILVGRFEVMDDWECCNYSTFTWAPYYNNYYQNLSILLNDSSLVWGTLLLSEQRMEVDTFSYKTSLRYNDGENYYYGWLRAFMIWDATINTESFIVTETCYCTIPNYPLIWGQTSLNQDLGEIGTTPIVSIFPNPTNSSFTITGKGLKAAEVLNTLGQQVATSQGKGESMQIDITNLPAGIYFVRITDEEGHKCVRKVVKE